MTDRTAGLRGKRVLVTGGAGFIGSHQVDRIIREDPDVLCVVDNLSLGRKENLAEAEAAFPDLRFHQEDVCDIEPMERIVRDLGIEVVFHLAVVPLPASLERPMWTVDSNVRMTLVLCELLRVGAYQTLIHFSSSEVYGTALHVPMNEDHPLLPLTPYAASKAAGDHVVLSYHKTFDLDATIVRPYDAAYAGVIPIAIRCALNDKPVTVFGDGEQTRDYIRVTDTAEAAVAIYREEGTRGEVINVASGHEVSVNCLVRWILDGMDSSVPVEVAPPRPGDVRRHCGGVGRLHELTGLEPAPISEKSLQSTLAWYRKGAGS